ncbi:MAG: tyrosine-type recombinase/integrase [Anaerolineae bacterium]
MIELRSSVDKWKSAGENRASRRSASWTGWAKPLRWWAATVAAFEAYFPIRGPAENSLKSVFLYRHQPLSPSYCAERLRTYGARCGIQVTPHQLRHSCATLLLNAGAPILTVQSILGHKHIDTTLGYARLYDGTVAADYYRTMMQVEQQLHLAEAPLAASVNCGQLVALVDAPSNGTLNEQ